MTLIYDTVKETEIKEVKLATQGQTAGSRLELGAQDSLTQKPYFYSLHHSTSQGTCFGHPWAHQSLWDICLNRTLDLLPLQWMSIGHVHH